MAANPWDAPDNDAPPISPLDTSSMPRAEDDAEAFATSPEFHDRTGDASFTAPVAPHDPDPLTRGRGGDTGERP